MNTYQGLKPMDLEPEATTPTTSKTTEFADPSARKSLELLRDTEALLRRQTVKTLVPILPPSVGTSLQETSYLAEDILEALAEIDVDELSDKELQPARILIGLSFVGFGALFIALLILYLYTLEGVKEIREYWYPYVWFVSLGVTGMFMLGREAMRSQKRK